MNYSRREFLKHSGLTVSSSILLYGCSKAPTPVKFRFFLAHEALCVIAMCEQIIPRDQDPGATDAGVIHYIDKKMVGILKHLQPVYRQGIAAVNASSMSTYKKPFNELEFDVQLQFMRDMESGQHPDVNWDARSQREFFNTVRTNTMQGFYGSPVHGGNRDYVSYTMMGLEYPLVVGQNRYKGMTR